MSMSKDLLFCLKVPVTGLPNVPTELTYPFVDIFRLQKKSSTVLNNFDGVDDTKHGEFLQQDYTGVLIYVSGSRWASEYK